MAFKEHKCVARYILAKRFQHVKVWLGIRKSCDLHNDLVAVGAFFFSLTLRFLTDQNQKQAWLKIKNEIQVYRVWCCKKANEVKLADNNR